VPGVAAADDPDDPFSPDDPAKFADGLNRRSYFHDVHAPPENHPNGCSIRIENKIAECSFGFRLEQDGYEVV